MSEIERRHFTRIPFDAQATLIDPASENQWPTELYDICLKGVLIKQPDNFQASADQAFVLLLRLGGEVELRFETRITHQERGQIGLKIEHMDIDSASHLHRLIELNLGDPALLERELNELINAAR